jgi:hypothetical protein
MGSEYPEEHIKVFLVAISDIRLEVRLNPCIQEAGDKIDFTNFERSLNRLLCFSEGDDPF